MAMHIIHFRDMEKRFRNAGIWLFDLFHDELFWLYVMLATIFVALSILIWSA